MNLDYSDSEIAFRERARAWLAENAPCEKRPAEGSAASEYDRAWQRKLKEGGFAGINWPAEYGGAGLSGIEQLIWFEEVARADAPHAGDMGIALNHAGPTLIVRGSEEQKQFYLPKILNADTLWCQGFSEPGAGSDLAAIKTRGTIDGDHLVVNGQKMWTSNAHHATYQELLVRTDPDSKRHRGLTWIIAEMDAPGITIQPIPNMMGERHVNMIFYDDVRIPLKNVVGGMGNGWSVAMSTLSFERGTYFVTEQISLVKKVEALRELAARVRTETGELAIENGAIAERLGQLKAKCLALRAIALSTMSILARQSQPGPEGSIVKLFTTTTYKEVAQLAVDIIGLNALDYGSDRTTNRWTYELMWASILTIAGGSSEIQREIIADRLLELPRAR
ncbi:acyl-CoA dehydrogenase family protein [Paracoccus pantotrophus]|uniref:acyl-CoA dehydrogenase family protein n=1 Tax=Paracoccus pantotrophus TaxID=82367 RepID=UPI00048D5D86|nr:acyl-CoA dehydrogenase family protein [Paracoccus pantotrophus]